MLTLALETSTSQASVALAKDDQILVETVIDQGLKHTKTLLPTIKTIFDQQSISTFDLDLIAVDIGPGSFTGLRIGLALAKGLAWAAKKPLVGVSSLDIMADIAPENLSPICPMIDARKGEVYAALYSRGSSKNLIRQIEPATFTPENLAKIIKEPTHFFGDGAIKWAETLTEILGPKYIRADQNLDYPKASTCAKLGKKAYEQGAESNPALILPIYIRPSDAEISLGNKIS